jgi:ribulose-phosphate 3-epimerase
MTEIIPAIIPKSFEDLEHKMSLVNGIVNLVQVDVCDGKFVPSKCWPYIGDEQGNFQKIVAEEEGFPFWQSLDFEADLMIKDPENVVDNWVKAGAKRIIIHVESSPRLLKFVKEFRKKYGYFGESIIGVELGIAIDIKTPNESLDEYLRLDDRGLPLVDFVQFMGIDNVGFQHQGFDSAVLGKIKSLRESHPDTIISVDGGVNLEDIEDLVAAGVNRLVSGSAIYESENIKDTIEEMRKIN